MNARHKNILVGAAILAVAVPAVGFAAKDAAVTGGFGFGNFKMHRGSGSEMPGMGIGMGRAMRDGAGIGPMGGEIGILSNAKVREALAASGVTLPSADEIKAFGEKMKAAREAESKLSDADKAELKKLRDATMEKIRQLHQEAAKAERDYLRSKGVALPSEEEIAKLSETAKKAGEALKTLAPERAGFGKGMMGEGRHGKGRGTDMRGRGTQNAETGAQAR